MPASVFGEGSVEHPQVEVAYTKIELVRISPRRGENDASGAGVELVQTDMGFHADDSFVICKGLIEQGQPGWPNPGDDVGAVRVRRVFVEQFLQSRQCLFGCWCLGLV
jgi:hypothetical protein